MKCDYCNYEGDNFPLVMIDLAVCPECKKINKVKNDNDRERQTRHRQKMTTTKNEK